jgi:hypothetical protein
MLSCPNIVRVTGAVEGLAQCGRYAGCDAVGAPASAAALASRKS